MILKTLQLIFQICWLLSLAIFSVLLEDLNNNQLNNQFYTISYYEYSSSSELIGLCVNGNRYAIKLINNLDMDGLSNFTILSTNKVVGNKHIETIKISIKIARRSLFGILKCVSELDMLHFIQSQTAVDHALFSSESDATQLILKVSWNLSDNGASSQLTDKDGSENKKQNNGQMVYHIIIIYAVK